MCYGFTRRNIMRVCLDLKWDDGCLFIREVCYIFSILTIPRKQNYTLCRLRYVFYNLQVIFPFNFDTNVGDL